MYRWSKFSGLSANKKRNFRFVILLLVFGLFSHVAEARTDVYTFLSDQSTVVQTGGFAGVHETYSIEGCFRLYVDFDTGTASFDIIDANLLEPSGFLYTQDLDELFNMTELVGTVVDDTTINFEGKTSDNTNTDIRITLTFVDDSVHLTGETIPPPNSADFFIYNLDAVARRKFAGGTGESNNPYKIATAEQLVSIRDDPNLLDKHFVLISDIDLDPNLPGGRIFDRAVIAADAAFTGVFDGNGHTISHLTIEGRSYLGLFGRIGPGAKISNLGLETVDVNGTGGSVGGLAGQNGKSGYYDFATGGNVSNCYSTGNVSGNRFVGGLVGSNYYGRITTSHSNCTVTGYGDVGGLVGDMWFGNITTSHSTGSVNGEHHAGGLVGWNYTGSIISSFSTGSVTGKYDTGGLVGWNQGAGVNSSTVIKCYSTGAVNGGSIVGGLVGFNSSYISTSYSTGTVRGGEYVGGLAGVNLDGNINTSYSSGAVTGDEYIGGLAGSTNNGTITTSYSTGTVSGQMSIGGLVGHDQSGDSSNVTLSFWDMETSGISDSNGGVGLTTAEMQDINTYLDAGWDFADEVLNGTCDYWQISPGDYPRLFYNTDNSPEMPEGLGTPGEPYLIRDVRDLSAMWSEPQAHYRLAESIDLSGPTWCMAVIPWFGGTFDGNGYVISNLHIKGGGNLGLFGKSDIGAEILNVRMEAVDVNGIGSCIGGIVGFNRANLSMSYSNGTVTGDSGVGGLVGCNDGNITTSYSSSAITGKSSIGGLVGGNGRDVSITNSYSTGTVKGEDYVGGLAGMDFFGHIDTSYSTCAVTGNNYVGGLVGFKRAGSNVTGFWDIEISGQTTSRGGTGKSTDEMQTATMFLEAGWDFNEIWMICEGVDYPRLQWQNVQCEE